MQSHMTDGEVCSSLNRIERLKRAVQAARPGVCTERALIWTDYFRHKGNREKDIHIRMAEALRDVLLKKRVVMSLKVLWVNKLKRKKKVLEVYYG